MNIRIKLAKQDDLKSYLEFRQKAFEDAYVDESLGLTKNLFSKKVFSSARIIDFCKNELVVNNTQKAWLIFDGRKLVGSVTIEDKGEECELRGFYVEKSYQGKGLGKTLWQKALSFAGKKDIVLDIYSHNKQGISVYLKWGFVIDEEKGKFFRHWPEWPEGVQAECLYMRYKAA